MAGQCVIVETDTYVCPFYYIKFILLNIGFS